MKKASLGLALLVALAFGGALQRRVQASESASSPTLHVVVAGELPKFKDDFNQDQQAIRIVLLLSPT
jgi:hypothetical protein